MLNLNQIYCGDCLELMKEIPDGSIDFVCTDLPFQMTEFDWDKKINFEKFFSECCRIIKKQRAIALFGTEPFSSEVRLCGAKFYKYDWIWEKNRASNFPNAKCSPLKITENIMIFSDGTISAGKSNNMLYNPQGVKSINKVCNRVGTLHFGRRRKRPCQMKSYIQSQTNYPKNILKFSVPNNKDRFHPTQKPTDLLEYLIKTYTNEGETVLDCCMGSGSTAVAAINTGRKFIGFELDEKIFNIANERIKKFMNEKSQILF